MDISILLKKFVFYTVAQYVPLLQFKILLKLQ